MSVLIVENFSKYAGYLGGSIGGSQLRELIFENFLNYGGHFKCNLRQIGVLIFENLSNHGGHLDTILDTLEYWYFNISPSMVDI